MRAWLVLGALGGCVFIRVVERTIVGLAAAWAQGWPSGLPAEKIAAIQAMVASGSRPAEVCKALAIGRSTFYKDARVSNLG